MPSVRVSLARLAGAFYAHPSRQLTLVGITGTNGKTTTSYLVEALLRARGLATGVIGTIQYVLGNETRPASQTTPEALDLQSMLAQMRDGGVRGVAMEVSSHALSLARADGLAFDVAVFTNLTQDHLDFHRTLENYRLAKRRLFELLAESPKPVRTAVVNADDPAGATMAQGLDVAVLPFGLGPAARVRAVEHVSSIDGIRMTVETPRGHVGLTSPLIGEHNVMNLLGAVGVGLALGMNRTVIGEALASVASVPGRFERVEAGQTEIAPEDRARCFLRPWATSSTSRFASPRRRWR